MGGRGILGYFEKMERQLLICGTTNNDPLYIIDIKIYSLCSKIIVNDFRISVKERSNFYDECILLFISLQSRCRTSCDDLFLWQFHIVIEYRHKHDTRASYDDFNDAC